MHVLLPAAVEPQDLVTPVAPRTCAAFPEFALRGVDPLHVVAAQVEIESNV